MAKPPRRRSGRASSALLAASGACLAGLYGHAARAASPMDYTVGYGSKSYPVVHLLWALLIVSLLVVAVVSVLLIAGLVRRLRERSRSTDERLRSNDPFKVPLARSGKGLQWIYIGSAVSAAVLIGAVIWTFVTLNAISVPPSHASLQIEVIGHQWWWEVRYLSEDPSQEFTTADEIHIPTGQPVRVLLASADVIHSFWVPQLSGKTDLIPGLFNTTWLEADRPGTYRGQCAEYCGVQHAHMAITLVAQPQAQFAAWRAQQLTPAGAPDSALLAQGQRDFLVHCGICHTVRGTVAGGRLGPDLTHLMTRSRLAAGTLPNTPGYLSGWIADPQHIKPGNYMPITEISGSELSDIRSYLESLD